MLVRSTQLLPVRVSSLQAQTYVLIGPWVDFFADTATGATLAAMTGHLEP